MKSSGRKPAAEAVTLEGRVPGRWAEIEGRRRVRSERELAELKEIGIGLASLIGRNRSPLPANHLTEAPWTTNSLDDSPPAAFLAAQADSTRCAFSGVPGHEPTARSAHRSTVQ